MTNEATIMTTETADGTEQYFYVVHGDVPELMPTLAFRREGKAVQYTRKILKCPHCLKRLTDIDVSTKAELYRNPGSRKMVCHAYKKCDHCHNEVGIRFA
jgi:hypothetical protein